jgi:DNA-binding MarR family transcriptional regulator
MNTLVLKYIEFAEFRDKQRSKFDLNTNECKILRTITKASINKSPIKVRDLLDIGLIASPATIHKNMKLLISKRLIDIQSDPKDGRVKYLHPTKIGFNLLREIGKRM